MEFLVKNVDLVAQFDDCMVIGLCNDNKLSTVAEQINAISQGYIQDLISKGEITLQLGDVTLLYQIPNTQIRKLLIVGCGDEKAFNLNAAKKWLEAICQQLKTKAINQVSLVYPDAIAKNIGGYQFARIITEVVNNNYYAFNNFKTQLKKIPPIPTKFIVVTDNQSLQQELEQGLIEGVALAQGIVATKNLANLPPNICNADYLAEQGKALAERFPSITTTVLDEKQLADLGMRAYLAVGQGSMNESKLTIIEYKGQSNPSVKPIVLVGKGLTFDSGGISIKPSASMDEMKYDMCGAATVFGVMQTIASLKLPINVVGLMAGCENMPSASSYRPGDIITTMSGQTVEVINTDAEGRLVLCDTLTYVAKFDPQYVIDIATLTGACIVALGHHYNGLIANDDQLAELLLSAAQQSGDKTWRLPMDEDFQKQIDSSIADIVNAGGRDGGTITAGCFLSRFTQAYKWAHLDIAGTAWTSGANKGATGRPVTMLVQFLLEQSKKFND
jgi:leucyl aminopeptidase